MRSAGVRLWFGVWVGAVGLLGLAGRTEAQLIKGSKPPAAAKAAAPAGAAAAGSGNAAATAPPVGQARLMRVPVNPSDPVAIVNNEVITRQQLADEAVARKGEEILETLIARKLIEQAMKAEKVEVTAAEIDAEIERVAMSMAGVSKEHWLRTLAKERNISPAQYARDIIYPALALRKLASKRVEITDEDLKAAYASQFGEQLVYRMIMTRSLEHAMQLWEELKKNPGGFENLARNDPRSIDPASRADGGKPINGPLRRHSYPREVTDKIFAQLVDGDPEDKDPTHKPKDGDITGPIQVTEETWLLVKREGLIPARSYDPNDPALAKQIRDAIFESKVQQHMEQVFAELMQAAAIENKLTGTVKLANQGVKPPVEGEAPVMTQAPAAMDLLKTDPSVNRSSGAGAAAAAAAAARAKIPATPAGVSSEDAAVRQKMLEKAASGAKPE
ncbi:MAG: hypothetical protein KatS3mg108_0960 [Isosphaeraceae bacterium]|jgi:foldase protein PrsA|nr:MAG: hypothetical protein KatS3mg108_0960 [Isosphaeraceae bacterium]